MLGNKNQAKIHTQLVLLGQILNSVIRFDNNKMIFKSLYISKNTQLLPEILSRATEWLGSSYDGIEINLISENSTGMDGLKMELEDLAIGDLAKVVVNKQRPCHTLIVCLDENLAEDSVLPVSPVNFSTKGDLLENVSTKRTIN